VFIEKLLAPFIKQPGAITPELLALTTQILVVTPARIGQGKVAPSVFIKQPGVITPEFLAPTTQILIVAPTRIRQGKVTPGVFVKQPVQ
jgi:hypothetical protein